MRVMDPIDYYHQQFPADLDFISRAGPYSTRGIISFFTLSPWTVLGLKQVKGCELQEFRSVENKHLFLMCYFFSTILDQAIHFNLRSEHKFFDFIARYPKFKGFLVTSHNNMHPNSLLVFATVYIKYFSVFGATENFRSLSRIMLRNICDFRRNTYPAMTERLPTKNQREEAVSIILNTIRNFWIRGRSALVRNSWFPIRHEHVQRMDSNTEKSAWFSNTLPFQHNESKFKI